MGKETQDSYSVYCISNLQFVHAEVGDNIFLQKEQAVKIFAISLIPTFTTIFNIYIDSRSRHIFA